MDDGRWTMDDGRWTMDAGPSAPYYKLTGELKNTSVSAMTVTLHCCFTIYKHSLQQEIELSRIYVEIQG